MNVAKLHVGLRLLFVLLTTTLSHGAFAQDEEYFGVFSGEPSLKVKTNSADRPTFVLLGDFKFTDPNGFEWITPKGWEVDGASIPQVAWSIVGGPMSGNYLHASIIHDRYCDIKTRTAHDTHRNFYYGMLANGVSNSKAKIMYWAVRTFGPSWKVTIKFVSQGIRSKFVSQKSDVQPPNISPEAADELIKNLDAELSLNELDALSDGLRKSFGSEEVQTVYPALQPAE